MSKSFQVLCVCSGNVCRSPVAERLLQAALDGLQPGVFRVRSAGTRALVGQAMTDQAAYIVRDSGGNPDGFLARQLSQDMILESDLILALSREHRSSVVQAAPTALRRTFTIRELGRMAQLLAGHPELDGDADDPVQRWTDLVASTPLVRPAVLAADGADDDVIDPYRRSAAAYRQMLKDLAPAMESLIDFERHYRT